MSKGLTFDDLAVPLRTLRLLAADFGHLPAPDVRLSTIYLNRVELDFFDDLAEFEAWREALGIAPERVNYRVQGGGRTQVLRTIATYAGAELELIGYGDVPTPALVGGAA
ncbi:hypothetical protein ACFV2X_36570 [Streptomyces sp. NPDC059679]|uniref:hypothetical protein n=1 Tax=Streptomyces sp. NPDC059679 TaxID=3346903 RepID=UPI0036B81B7B